MNLAGHCYVAKNGEGFTTLADLAQTAVVGGRDVIVAAPGVTGYLRQRYERNVTRLWSELLDKMEERYEMDEDPEKKRSAEYHDLAQFISGIETALAILRHGVADDAALASVTSEANVRYEQEA